MKAEELKMSNMSDEEILKIDFYDVFGSWAIWYTDKEKVKYYREIFGKQD